jgi:hypothetical protein
MLANSAATPGLLQISDNLFAVEQTQKERHHSDSQTNIIGMCIDALSLEQSLHGVKHARPGGRMQRSSAKLQKERTLSLALRSTPGNKSIACRVSGARMAAKCKGVHLSRFRTFGSQSRSRNKAMMATSSLLTARWSGARPLASGSRSLTLGCARSTSTVSLSLRRTARLMGV